MKHLAKDYYMEKGDFLINFTTISILGKTVSGKIHLEYNNGEEWEFKTVEPDFNLEDLG